MTFTNKAANEMRERVERMLDVPLNRLWISTFHSACVRILRQHIDRLGYKRSFVIYDETDRSSLLKACMADLRIDTEQYQPRAIGARISALKNNLTDAEQYGKASAHFGFEEAVSRTYSLYQEQLKQSNGLDFDDLLMLTVKLFEQHQDVLGYYQGLFHHILIDEYQDTNHAQYRLVRLLTMQRKNLCVVGDDDQSIYRWRGADVGLILQFEIDYPEAKIVKLEQNYRSTQTILEAASYIIAPNLQRKPHKLWTENEQGLPITIDEAYNEQEEAQRVAQEIERMLSKAEAKGRDIAVMYRTNAQSRALEETFIRYGIAYKLVGATRFYERREVKDIIAYL
ncbi:MAG: UvrD-helicase domain-containing protein, partial [Bacteroidota bacterium]